tara:strand:- start:12181 stop:12774 length:594 start_codon:yes stop_codon:yes gene_type:complete
MNLDFYFPTPVWWEDTTIDNLQILNLCKQLRLEDPDGRSVSNNGGWQSKDFKAGTYKEMNDFVDAVISMSAQCIHDYGYYENSYKFEMLNMWFNVNSVGNSNQIHTHAGSFISGVYYVSANSSHSNLIFYKNLNEDFIVTSAGDVERHTSISGATCRYPAKTGRLILFPSNLPHGVLPEQSSEERISLAFNLRMTNV